MKEGLAWGFTGGKTGATETSENNPDFTQPPPAGGTFLRAARHLSQQ